MQRACRLIPGSQCTVQTGREWGGVTNRKVEVATIADGETESHNDFHKGNRCGAADKRVDFDCYSIATLDLEFTERLNSARCSGHV